MSSVGAIAVLVLTPILWGLSHKYFSFIYFGNIGNAILKELNVAEAYTTTALGACGIRIMKGQGKLR